MSETQKLKQEIAELHEQIAGLKAHLDVVQRLSHGLQATLLQVLPELLREQPNPKRAQELLASSYACYKELRAHPERAEQAHPEGPPGGETRYEYVSSSWLYESCALSGVWPDVDPKKFREQLSIFHASLRS